MSMTVVTSIPGIERPGTAVPTIDDSTDFGRLLLWRRHVAAILTTEQRQLGVLRAIAASDRSGNGAGRYPQIRSLGKRVDTLIDQLAEIDDEIWARCGDAS